MTLQQYCTNKDGTIKRGAPSRVAEWLGIDCGQAKRYITGEWKLGPERQHIVNRMIAAGARVTAHSTAPKCPRKSKKLNGTRK